MADAASPVVLNEQADARTGRAWRGRRGLIISAIVALAASAFVLRVARTMPDFEVYWQASTRAAAGEPLYREADGHYQFKYLPGFAVLAFPVSLAPLGVAKAIWFSLSLAALALLLRLSLPILPEQRKPGWVLVLITVIVLGKFYGHELVLGQVNLLFATVATGAILALKMSRDVLAGALVAIAIVLKPYGVLLLPWLVARGRPRSVATAAGALAGVLMLPAILYGFSGNVALHRDWLATVVATSNEANVLNVDNVSWLAMYTRWFGSGRTAPVLAGLTAVGALALVAWMWRTGRHVVHPEGLDAALLLVLIPLMSPQGWDYVLLVSTPAVVYLANYEDRLPRRLRVLTVVALAGIGLTTFDLMGREAYGAFMRMSGITLCFFVVIAAVAMLRRRRIA
jgi:glycosyl transferase family 87